MNTGGRGQSQMVFTYCKKIGHTIETCYKKHGFPPHMKQRSSINNMTSNDVEKRIMLTVSLKKERVRKINKNLFSPRSSK